MNVTDDCALMGDTGLTYLPLSYSTLSEPDAASRYFFSATSSIRAYPLWPVTDFTTVAIRAGFAECRIERLQRICGDEVELDASLVHSIPSSLLKACWRRMTRLDEEGVL